MGLQLWLPLNGDAKNYGLKNIDVLDYGTSEYSKGKIGKCRSFVGNGYLKLINSFGIEPYKDFSCCYWIKEISNNTLSGFRVVYQCGNLIIGHYNDYINIYNGSDLDFFYKCDTTDWVHCCLTYQSSSNIMTIYINGIKCSTRQPKSLNNLSSTTALIGKRNNESYLLEGYLNDFRLYDECLSPKQIKYISQAMICHYPMGNVDGKIGGRNLIRNGKGDKKAGFFKYFDTVTDQYGEVTLKSKWSYTGIDLVPGFVLGCRDYEVGAYYIWSYDIMYTAWNFPSGSSRGEFWIGQRYAGAPSGEDATGKWQFVTAHDLPVVGENGCKLNEWYHVKRRVLIPSQASSNVGTHGQIMLYNPSKNVEASFTARFKNVKLEKGNIATPWTPAPEDNSQFYDNIIPDISGYRNNATVKDSTCPTWSNDSPRYLGSYKFDGKSQYINCGTNTMIQGLSEFTVNCWAYMDDWTKFNSRLFSCTQNGGYNTEESNGLIKFGLSVYTNADMSKYQYNSSIGGYPGIKLSDMSTGWHMITCVYKNSIGDAIYLDGNLYEKKTYLSYGVHYNMNANLFLGCESGGYQPANIYFNGNLSDFRIYATALSESDVLNLYQSSASLDSQGNLMLSGEVVE